MSGVPSYIKLSPQMDMATLINALNTNFNQVQSQDRRKVITDEDGFDRIVIGKQEDGSYNIKVSGDGKDVNTATPDELIMSSEWDLWKIINSGRITAAAADVARSGTVTISSTNIAYVNDIYIKIDDFYGNTEDINTSGYAGNLQAFIRDATYRKDISNSRIMYWNGTNKVNRHDCYFVTPNGWITIRRIFRWAAGSVALTPRNHMSLDAYWAVANPSRIFVPGVGGGGTPTGANVFHDRTIYNASSVDYPDLISDITGDTMIAPGDFGTTESETIVLDDVNAGYYFNEYTIFVYANSLPA